MISDIQIGFNFLRLYSVFYGSFAYMPIHYHYFLNDIISGYPIIL